MFVYRPITPVCICLIPTLPPLSLFMHRFVSSWIETRDIQSEKANLMILFDKYVPACLEVLRTRLKKITPIPEISHIQMLCNLLGETGVATRREWRRGGGG